MTISGWIGVDLDGTLARYGGWNNGEIGEPIPLMVGRVRGWIADGVEVRIMTARVSVGENENPEFSEFQKSLIKNWCKKHIGQELPVTYKKDFAMIELWDDRTVQGIPNTGKRADGS